MCEKIKNDAAKIDITNLRVQIDKETIIINATCGFRSIATAQEAAPERMKTGLERSRKKGHKHRKITKAVIW